MVIDEREALKRLRRGDVVRRENRDGATVYWFENPYQEVDPSQGNRLSKKLGKRFKWVGGGDGLFGTETSQSWYAVKLRRGEKP